MARPVRSWLCRFIGSDTSASGRVALRRRHDRTRRQGESGAQPVGSARAALTESKSARFNISRMAICSAENFAWSAATSRGAGSSSGRRGATCATAAAIDTMKISGRGADAFARLRPDVLMRPAHPPDGASRFSGASGFSHSMTPPRGPPGRPPMPAPTPDLQLHRECLRLRWLTSPCLSSRTHAG